MKYTRLLLLIGLASTTVLSACKKKCDLPDDVDSGEIIKTIVIYPDSGYQSANLTEDQYLITGSHHYAGRYDYSTDGGVTQVPMDYSKYSILCYPMTTTCNASFDRKVTIDHANGIIVYTIKAQDCGTCKEARFFENYVAIPAVPASYQVLYDVSLETK